MNSCNIDPNVATNIFIFVMFIVVIGMVINFVFVVKNDLKDLKNGEDNRGF